MRRRQREDGDGEEKASEDVKHQRNDIYLGAGESGAVQSGRREMLVRASQSMPRLTATTGGAGASGMRNSVSLRWETQATTIERRPWRLRPHPDKDLLNPHAPGCMNTHLNYQ